MKSQKDVDNKLIIVNRQLFNKKETIILPEETPEDVPFTPVKENVLAAMLASFEKLGYKFSYQDIRKMAIMSEERLTEQVYLPLLDALKEAKGMDVEHHILFPDFPRTAQVLDIDTLSGFRFMSYFTTLYDEYIAKINAFAESSLTSALRDAMKALAQRKQEEDEAYKGDGREILSAIYHNSLKESGAASDQPELITIHLGEMRDYYEMVRNMLSGKTSLSEYDREIVRFALENFSYEHYMPEVVPFRETWALVAAHDFLSGKYRDIDVRSIPDFERLLAALTPGGDVSLAKKQKYRNFTNQERIALFNIFTEGLRNNYPVMCESAIPKYAKKFIVNVLKRRLHFDEMKGKKAFTDFVRKVSESRSQMSLYAEALANKDYLRAAGILAAVSPGVLLDHSKDLISKAEAAGDPDSADQILRMVRERCANAPMDKLLTLKKVVDSNVSAEEEPVKFRFKRSRYVAVELFPNTSLKLSEKTKDRFSNILRSLILGQLARKEDIGKVYIQPELKNCPVPVVGRSDSGKNRTVAIGTKIPLGQDRDILRAALYKKGPRDGFFDFSCAFLDEKYSFLGQISWNNLKENFAYHSGDCDDTTRGVTEIIDVNLSGIKNTVPGAKYIVYEGIAWDNFTTVDGLTECFLTFSNVSEVGEGIKGAGKNPLNPADVKFRVDLTGKAYTNIPVIYDIEDNTVTILNMATHNHLEQFGKADPPDTHRHFDLPPDCQAIENYAGTLAQTVYYIDKRLMQDKVSVYDLAILNVEARNGVLTDRKDKADVIFALDREPVRKGQKLVTIYDKDVINTEYMVPKAQAGRQ